VLVAAVGALLASPAPAQKPPAAPAVPAGVAYEPGVEYANPDGQHLKLDLARAKDGDGPFPAVLCIHGGGFRAGSRQGYDALCLRLARGGYVAATIDYRLAPKYPFPAAVHDTKEAVRWLRANARKYRIDPERIGVTGGSAGGHLAQFLGVTRDVKDFGGDGGNRDQPSRAACVVNQYGPMRVMPGDRLVKVPDGITDRQAAGLLLKGLAAAGGTAPGRARSGRASDVASSGLRMAAPLLMRVYPQGRPAPAVPADRVPSGKVHRATSRLLRKPIAGQGDRDVVLAAPVQGRRNEGAAGVVRRRRALQHG
jgi:hypothetical protein